MRGDLIFYTRPDFVRVNKRQRQLVSLWPGAKQQPPLGSASIGRPLWIGKIRQVVLQIVSMNGLKMAGNLPRVQNLAYPAYQRQPRAEHSVSQAPVAVLVLRTFLFENCDGLGRVVADHAL